jgi:farnesyl-diphosphate farnesyltransferase
MKPSGDLHFCEVSLGKVSRTFAVNIRVLRGEAYRAVLIAYLLCRMADTVEDDPSFPPSGKRSKLIEYASLFPPSVDYERRYETFLEGIPFREGEDDLMLLHNGGRVLREFVKLPADLVGLVSRHVREMAEGMARFQERAEKGGISFLRDEEDLRRYCYYVAGTVGIMLTGIFTKYSPPLSPSARRILEDRCVSFGLGLQLTNIAKDFAADRERGWCYVPRSFFPGPQAEPVDPSSPAGRSAFPGAHGKLVRMALTCLDDALEYTLALPRRVFRFRLFCLWPLFMAVETLGLLNRNRSPLSGKPVKITRDDVRRIVRNTGMAVFSNGILRAMYKRARLRAVSYFPA